MARTFVKRWLATAFSRSLGIADLWSSVVGAAVAILIHFFPNAEKNLTPLTWQIPLWTLAGVMLVRLISSPYWIWKAEHEKLAGAEKKIANLEDAARPKIKLSFSDADAGCVRPNTKINLSPDHPHFVPCTYYRIRVDATSSSVVSSCAGRMIAIYRDERCVVSGENIVLTFAPGDQPDTTAKSVYPRAAEYLDFLVITHSNQIIIPTYLWRAPSSIGWNDIFSTPGIYKFRIMVTSPHSDSVEIMVSLLWTLNRAFSSVVPASNDPASSAG